MKKFVLRAAVLAMLTAGIATASGIAGASGAMACGNDPEKSYSFAASLPQINFRDQGPNVVALQLALRKEGYDLQGTGVYSVRTLAAVQDFQRKHGIKASGIVGAKTWNALVGHKQHSLTGKFVSAPTFSIMPGERNLDKLATLRGVLERIHPYSSLPQKGINDPGFDTYGPETQALVKDFQKRAGIKASGIVGPKTWAALIQAVSVSGGWTC